MFLWSINRLLNLPINHPSTVTWSGQQDLRVLQGFRPYYIAFLTLLFFVIPLSINAAPGDLIFQDDFERSTLAPNWSVNASGGGDAAIGTHTSQSGTRSLYTRWNRVTVLSRVIDLSSLPAAELALWLREGSDAFSEDPEKRNESLILAYLNNVNTWSTLLTHAGNAYSGGTIRTLSFNLPTDALHAGFRLAVRQNSGDDVDWDYYHLDDFIITERAPVSAIVGGFCDDFESGLTNWQISSGAGQAGISSQTARSPNNSLFLSSDNITVTSVPVDLRRGEGEISYWLRRGSDSFSEDPDSGEDLHVEYLTSSGSWAVLDSFSGSGTPGEQFNVVHPLPADGQADVLQIRFALTGSDRWNGDYWHVDDVCLHQSVPPELLAYYSMDLDEEASVSDDSSNSNHGTKIGSVSWNDNNPAQSGDPGTCGYMDVAANFSVNVQSAIDTGLDVDADIGNAGTISFWYKSNEAWSVDRDRQLFDASAAFNGNGTGQKFFSLMLQDNSSLRFAVEDTEDEDYEIETDSYNFRADAWVYITATWDLRSNRLQVFVNGSLAEADTIDSNGQLGNLDTLYFGDNRSSYVNLSTGNSANGSFDEIRIYDQVLSQQQIQDDMAVTHPCPAAQIDHYVILHSGQGVTCEAEPVEVVAHDSAHLETPPAAETSIVISAVDATSGDPAANASWSGRGVTDLDNGQAQYQFSGTETGITLYLGNSVDQRININVSDTDGLDEHSGSANETDNDLVFSATGFRFYADGTVNAIDNQIAGKASNLAPNAQRLSLKAIETNSLTGACETRLNGLQTIEMAFQCIDPSSCKASNGVSIDAVGISENPASGVSSYTDVDLDFGTDGTASFVFQYDDAGQIQLHVRKQLAASDPEPAITLSGASNAFAVIPAGLCVESSDPNSECAAPYASCTKFTQAGQAFDLAVSAVTWETAEETDSDFCNGNIVTPNFQLNNIILSHNLLAPATGVSGNLGVNQVDMLPADNGSHSLQQTVSEVGVFSFTAMPPVYFGETIAASTSDAIGRFYPADFLATVNDNGAMAPGCGSFSYTGQAMSYATSPKLNITARNATAATTQNYTGDFMKLLASNGGAVNFTTPSADASQPGKDNTNNTALNASLNPNLDGLIDNGDGTLVYPLSVLDEFRYLRNDNALVAPYTSDIDLPLLAINDGDGVADDGSSVVLQPVGVDIRYGRLVVDDAYGPQTDDLIVRVRAEQFDGTDFIDNSDDYCTIITPASAVSLNNWQDSLSSGDTSVSSSTGLLAGSGEIVLSAPGIGTSADTNDGSVDLTLDLSTTTPAQIWLLNDEDGDGVYAENPLGTAGFGMYRGDDRFLYWRETQ